MGDKRVPTVHPDKDDGRAKAAPKQRTGQSAQHEAKKVEVGMVVEADAGDLGQQDISEAKVTGIVHDRKGEVETIVAEKGTVFRKKLEIPTERIQSVEQKNGAGQQDDSPGKVVFSASEAEVDALKPVGAEALPPEGLNKAGSGNDLLDQTGNALPTDVGQRRREKASAAGASDRAEAGGAEEGAAGAGAAAKAAGGADGAGGQPATQEGNSRAADAPPGCRGCCRRRRKGQNIT